MTEKILIIKMSALGDLFMALPHVDVILNHHRDHDIWLLTSPPYLELFTHHPRLRTVAIDRGKWFDRSGTMGTLGWIRKQRFSRIYDLQGNRTSRLLVRFSNAETAVGTQPQPIYHFHPKRPYTRSTKQNVFDRLNETLGAANLPAAQPGCRLYPSDEDRERVDRFKTEHRIERRRYALMHAGSSGEWPSKRWPKDRFRRLVEMIENSGIRCVWLGGREDGTVNRSLSQHGGIDATGQFSLLQLYLMGKDALFAVTSDSGPMHILAASGLAVYSFFGPTDWVRSHAGGQGGRVITAHAACSPCFLGTCPSDKQHRCLNTIEPEVVFSLIRENTDFP